MSTTRHEIDEQLDYPDSDGKPMGETPVHRDNLSYLVDMLRDWYKTDPMVYVSGNMFLYYEPGNRTRALVPDVFMAKGIPKETTPRRRVYLAWREGKMPDIVIELTSKSSQDEDMDDKFWLYRDRLKIPEYIVFDPLGEYLEPQLQGWSLQDGEYVPLPTQDGRLVSEVLGLHLETEGDYLRLFDPARNAYIASPPELREILEELERELAEKHRSMARKEREIEVERAARMRAEEELAAMRKRLDVLEGPKS